MVAGCLLCIAAYAGSDSTTVYSAAVTQPREFFMLTPGAGLAQPAMQRAVYPEMSAAKWQQATAATAASAALFLGAQSASAGPFTQSEIASLTYEQIKGTGLANTCPRVEAPSSAAVAVPGGSRLTNFCLEPTSFQVLEEKLTKQGLVTEAVNTKVTTRQTYTLTGIEGSLASEGGKLTFREQDGIDYAASTVQMPGGERVPFLFTVKNLVAKAEGPANAIDGTTKFSGNFKVPSYRTGLFLDPKGRGTTTGYDQAVALPAMQAGGDEQMFKENNKKFEVLDGTIDFKVTAVNAELGEIGGVFVQQQPSDTDLGSKTPKQVLLKGVWFGTVDTGL
jgi:photosystem II oxygen-evolving enhancer protein 1